MRYGFVPHSVIMILGEGDLRRTVQPAEEQPPPSLHPRSDRHILEALRQPPPALAQLTPPAAMRLKALRKAGWHVHVVNHATLKAQLRYETVAQPLKP